MYLKHTKPPYIEVDMPLVRALVDGTTDPASAVWTVEEVVDAGGAEGMMATLVRRCIVPCAELREKWLLAMDWPDDG